MKVLLDTHAFLWFMAGDTRLSPKARKVMSDANTELFLSAASVWEMAIKAALGRLVLPVSVGDYIAGKVRNGLHIMPIEWMHAAAVQDMPTHHRDPFDRLIVAQAIAENLPLVSSDRLLKKYGLTLIW